MNRNSIATVMLLIAAASGLTNRLSAQTNIAEKDRVRVVSPRVTGTFTVVGAHTDSLVLRTSAYKAPFSVGRREITSLEKGHERSVLYGMGRGAAVGALALGFIAYTTSEDGLFSKTDSAIMLGSVGGVLGLIIGSAIRGYRWEPVQP